MLAIVAFVLIHAAWFQAREARRLRALESNDRPRTLAVAVAARREAASRGVIGELRVPRLDLSVVVLEGVDARALANGVGHVARTAFPGESGNVGLAAHRDTYFRRLKNIRLGDRVTMRTPDGTFDYAVDSVLVVKPDRGDLLDDSGTPRLTLVTCYPFHWIGPAPERFVVLAHATSATRPEPREPPPAASAAAAVTRRGMASLARFRHELAPAPSGRDRMRGRGGAARAALIRRAVCPTSFESIATATSRACG